MHVRLDGEFHFNSTLLKDSRRATTDRIDVFEPKTETESGHFACQDSDFSQIFKLIVSASEKILNNTNVAV